MAKRVVDVSFAKWPHGKGSGCCLSVDESCQYEVVKMNILKAYELVPEAYRQKFRNSRKGEKQTYVEFGREKEMLFDRWCCQKKLIMIIHDYVN